MVKEVFGLLEEARVPCVIVNNIADVVDDPHLKAREMIVELDFPIVGPVPLSGIVPKLSKSPGKIEKRAPLVGENNEEIYGQLLNMSKSELEQLKQEDII